MSYDNYHNRYKRTSTAVLTSKIRSIKVFYRMLWVSVAVTVGVVLLAAGYGVIWTMVGAEVSTNILAGLLIPGMPLTIATVSALFWCYSDEGSRLGEMAEMQEALDIRKQAEVDKILKEFNA